MLFCIQDRNSLKWVFAGFCLLGFGITYVYTVLTKMTEQKTHVFGVYCSQLQLYQASLILCYSLWTFVSASQRKSWFFFIFTGNRFFFMISRGLEEGSTHWTNFLPSDKEFLLSILSLFFSVMSLYHTQRKIQVRCVETFCLKGFVHDEYVYRIPNPKHRLSTPRPRYWGPKINTHSWAASQSSTAAL